MNLTILKFLIFSFIAVNTYGQKTINCPVDATIQIKKGDSLVVIVADKNPYLKNGLSEYYKWIELNTNKKLKTKKNEEKRKLYVSFVVDENGYLSNFQITKSQGEIYDREALRLVSTSSHEWIPGQCGDRKVRVRFTMAIPF